MPIEQIRMILAVALAVVGFLIWQAWQRDYGPEPAPVSESAQTTPAVSPEVPDVPAVPKGAREPAPAVPSITAPTNLPEIIHVSTDLLEVEIDPNGGGLTRLALRAYPVAKDAPDTPMALLSQTLPDFFIAQSGLLGERAAPNHLTKFTASADRFVLDVGRDTLEVPLEWRSEDGVKVTKRYVFHRNRYLIDVIFRVENNSDTAWSGQLYGQFKRAEVARKGGLFRTYTYTGGVISTQEKPYEKIKFGEMAESDLKRASEGGWVAMIQHYFAAAWVPEQNQNLHFYSLSPGDNRFVIGLITPAVSVAPGNSAELRVKLYAGPKDQDRMKAVVPHLERTVDYGWLWMIAEPIFWLLTKIHGFVGNWGWSIIFLTCVIKLAFFHLSATSYKSMARMRKLQPRIVALRDRYANDKQRMNQAMMELYKTEKINPLGGCFPILVQIPVFISLYWVLLESVEMRQAPFMWWLDDLSAYDPLFVLPILMGITMLVQQKLNPAPPDPIQAKIMMALPFVFTFFFLFFPSGLVLYWFVNNLLSIIQQWVITKKIVGST